MNKNLLVLSASLAAAIALPAFAQTTTSTTVTTEKSHAGAGAGVIGGAATGALVGGPVGAVVGGVIGAVAGSTMDPPAEVKTYVRTTHVEPVVYTGPVALGDELPATVTVYEVPKYERYRWTYVNHQRILVDNSTHKIVSIINDDQ
ncbi:hypothetical protein DJ021_11225 [Phenylobacterium hankyongense]|uniref:DUF1236 domain-containing protein n=1 Tax=Phenylobacterium hankyongense TaxID=1813876 RepID=A0A328B0K9_9CAUL|nr:DUF1236 domain-containing protein [Phenylobacterium hankyongense]RAK60337.1 hypothetical protein DJ021_11225 [Phenylobacterium hankyongense]